MYFHPQSFHYDLERDSNVTAEAIDKVLSHSQLATVPSEPATITCEAFESQYRQPLKPVVLKGVIRDSRAFEKWQDLEYVKAACQEQTVKTTQTLVLDIIKMQRHPRYWFVSKAQKACYREKFFKETRVPDFIDQLLQATPDEKLPYARNIQVPEPLKKDIPALSQMSSEPHGTSIFIGRRSYTDCHEHHGSDAFMCQIRGKKRVVLFPPDEVHNEALCANPLFLKNWAAVRVFESQGGGFEKFDFVKPIVADVDPGDALFIPNPWWHAVVHMDDEVGITLPLWYPPFALRLTDPQTRWLLLWPPMYRVFRKAGIEEMPKWSEVLKSATPRELLWTFFGAPLRLLYKS